MMGAKDSKYRLCHRCHEVLVEKPDYCCDSCRNNLRKKYSDGK
jgi:RNA polymerase subunit RPABC4/transcription elongation factor Spt4